MKNTLRRLAVADTAAVAFASAGAVNAATAQAADYEFVNYYSTIDDCELTGRTGFANGDWTEWVCVYHTALYFNWGLLAKF